VARMIMMGLENTGEVPFHTVYLHGLVRDEKGEKMSKVKGNVLNPLEAIGSYGTDALRLALSTGTSPGNDLRLSKEKLEAARNFANKLWNASRFILGNMPDMNGIGLPNQTKLALEDRWILSRLNRLIVTVEGLMNDFHFGEAERQIHDFIWSEFCDWYIEIAKLRLDEADSPMPVLAHVLDNSLRLLHPFMPFITEEIWQNLKVHLDTEAAESIMISPYPMADESCLDEAAEKRMAVVTDIVRSIRNTRAEFKVEPSRWIEALVAANEASLDIVSQSRAIERLARVNPLTIIDASDRRPDMVKTIVLEGAEVILPMSGMIDLEAERMRLNKEIDSNQAEIARIEARLNDENFISKAPPDVVERERKK
ncbi:MAG: class I tRNA ligase family protein, partial [Dehalococcoidia bacterium]|nr:class I tRNA ligase family protein [Dehalococcoidia bacterium]